MSATVIHVGGQTPEFHAFADFMDGRNAHVRRVAIGIEESDNPCLVIEPPEGTPIRWPLDEVRAVPDQADHKHLIIRPSWEEPARLLVEDPETKRILAARCPKLRKRPATRNRGRLMFWAIGAIGSVALIIFLLVPLLANQLATLLPPRGEQALGDATLNQIRTSLGGESFQPVAFCENPGGQAALEQMRERIAGATELPYPLRVHVLDHPMVNAFALPGGHVILFRGLIDAAESPDEVAAVFAHEVGHVVNRDPARGALRSAGSMGVLGLLFGDFAGGTIVLFMVNRLIDATYSQDAEAKADEFALAAMAEAHIRPSSLATMFERLREKHGDSDGIVAHFQAHPSLGDRIQVARSADGLIAGHPRPSLSRDAWRDLQGICQSGDTSLDTLKNQRGS